MTNLARRLLGKKTCLCTTAKRDSIYDDPDVSTARKSERQSADQYGFPRKDKSTRMMHQTSMDDSDDEDNFTVAEKLRRASPQSPANIPMLVVLSFNPDENGSKKRQIEIQRGYPVNAQYILNEWLFIKTADNEEGFVPYFCCRPVFRRQSTKSLNHIESSYKLHDFDLQKPDQVQSPATPRSTFTQARTKKLSLSTNFTSPRYLSKTPTCKRRQDFTSSSCGGDSGVSDCESSINNHNGLDLSIKSAAPLSNLHPLRSSSNALKKTGLIVQDLPLKKSSKTNQIKSQLLISSNSAFTKIVKKDPHQESNRLKPFHHGQDIPLLSSARSNPHRLYDSFDETANLSSLSSKYLHNNNHNLVTSPYIRRTPYTRRSLTYHSQSALRKPLSTKLLSSSSPDPFKKTREQRLRNVVLAEPPISQVIALSKPTIERHFSDLSLNQIEKDSLSPPTPALLIRNQTSFSCSPSGSSSATSPSTEDSSTPFIHIQMTNHGTGRIPVIYASSNITSNSHHTHNSDTPAKNSASFVHNVSITV